MLKEETKHQTSVESNRTFHGLVYEALCSTQYYFLVAYTAEDVTVADDMTLIARSECKTQTLQPFFPIHPNNTSLRRSNS